MIPKWSLNSGPRRLATLIEGRITNDEGRRMDVRRSLFFSQLDWPLFIPAAALVSN